LCPVVFSCKFVNTYTVFFMHIYFLISASCTTLFCSYMYISYREEDGLWHIKLTYTRTYIHQPRAYIHTYFDNIDFGAMINVWRLGVCRPTPLSRSNTYPPVPTPSLCNTPQIFVFFYNVSPPFPSSTSNSTHLF
jgi:hypothetical protein